MTVADGAITHQRSAERPDQLCALAGTVACVGKSKEPALFQVSMIVEDPAAAAAFYARLFHARPDTSVNPQSYQGIFLKDGLIGFSSPDARTALSLQGPATSGRSEDAPCDTGFFTIKLACASAVFAFTQRAEQLGAQILMQPTTTAFGWYCSVLRDPAGHVVRLATTLT